MGSVQYYWNSTIRWIQQHPFVLILAAIIIIFFAVFRRDESSSSAGMWFWLVIAIALFLTGMGLMTGMGFGMSF